MRSQRAAGLFASSFAAVLTGCSSGPATPTQTVPTPVDLGNTPWIGQCSGGAVGAYSFTFRQTSDEGGTVEVSTPDTTSSVTVPYSVTKADANGYTAFTMFFTPPWKGGLRRDYANMALNYQVGDAPGVRNCDLERSASPSATG